MGERETKTGRLPRRKMHLTYNNYVVLFRSWLQIIIALMLMPVLLMLLNRAGFVTRAQLIGLRRYMIVAAFVLAAVLTPRAHGAKADS